jgi:hypothetical protein
MSSSPSEWYETVSATTNPNVLAVKPSPQASHIKYHTSHTPPPPNIPAEFHSTSLPLAFLIFYRNVMCLYLLLRVEFELKRVENDRVLEVM